MYARQFKYGRFHQNVQRSVARVPELVGRKIFRIYQTFPLTCQNGLLFPELGVGKEGVESGFAAVRNELDGADSVGGQALSPRYVAGDLGLVHGGVRRQAAEVEEELNPRDDQQQDENNEERCAGACVRRIHMSWSSCNLR